MDYFSRLEAVSAKWRKRMREFQPRQGYSDVKSRSRRVRSRRITALFRYARERSVPGRIIMPEVGKEESGLWQRMSSRRKTGLMR